MTNLCLNLWFIITYKFDIICFLEEFTIFFNEFQSVCLVQIMPVHYLQDLQVDVESFGFQSFHFVECSSTKLQVPAIIVHGSPVWLHIVTPENSKTFTFPLRQGKKKRKQVDLACHILQYYSSRKSCTTYKMVANGKMRRYPVCFVVTTGTKTSWKVCFVGETRSEAKWGGRRRGPRRM